MIYDPLRNRFFRIALDAFQVLQKWQGGIKAEELIGQLQQQRVEIDQEDLQQLVLFLRNNQLLQTAQTEEWQFLKKLSNAGSSHWLMWLVHHYLFIQIPLWKPDRFLARTAPQVGRLINRNLRLTIRILGVVGILLMIRQWEQFSATFLHFFSWQGLLLYGVTLIVIKSAHELGHAYVANRKGCRVTSMGVAFLVLFPVLYTDTTDSWRLTNKRERLDIVLAGVLTELHIALLATFCWSILPDGTARSIAFFVATTSWITSLTVNISPFMRFDGYFALSDWMGAENLQPRAFAMTQWNLREILFGFGEEPPEWLKPQRQRLFILYAWGTWIYRLFLFLGIALLVYYFAFKVLGILLFLVEIVWFIGLPIYKEMAQWWKRRTHMTLNRASIRTLILVTIFIGFSLIPWRTTISIPAVLETLERGDIFATEDARVTQIYVQRGQQVREGDPLVSLISPEIEHQIVLTEVEVQNYRELLTRRAGSRLERERRHVIEQSLQQKLVELQGLKSRQTLMTLYSPLKGTVSELLVMHPGEWVSRYQPLMTVVPDNGVRVVGFLEEHDLNRVDIGAKGSWIANSGEFTVTNLNLDTMDTTAVVSLKYPELASVYGGDIASSETDAGELRPELARYRLLLTTKSMVALPARYRLSGSLLLEGKSRSWVEALVTNMISLWIRESGF
ncbi:MAG TPA: HlyD family efflux transporter periplasmic adaptor subunit [Gammaproteobacteria bacterium]|nr:HlyD family efflux transporter periplasmic adaptor subunit [Gammaproteobacteria bacterium]